MINDSKTKQIIVSFLIGLALWGIGAICIFILSGVGAAFVIIGVLILVIALMISANGRGRYYKFGSAGHFLKFFLHALIGLTVIGLIPVAYWTGASILRMLGYLQYET